MSTEKEVSEEIEKCFEQDVYVAILHALEKQLLYKPKWYKDYAGQCKCGALFLDKSTKYCGNCGQRLSWEGSK